MATGHAAREARTSVSNSQATPASVIAAPVATADPVEAPAIFHYLKARDEKVG
jgi:hypothetical protein